MIVFLIHRTSIIRWSSCHLRPGEPMRWWCRAWSRLASLTWRRRWTLRKGCRSAAWLRRLSPVLTPHSQRNQNTVRYCLDPMFLIPALYMNWSDKVKPSEIYSWITEEFSGKSNNFLFVFLLLVKIWKKMLEKDCNHKFLNFEEQLSSMRLHSECTENTDEDEKSWQWQSLPCLKKKKQTHSCWSPV